LEQYKCSVGSPHSSVKEDSGCVKCGWFIKMVWKWTEWHGILFQKIGMSV